MEKQTVYIGIDISQDNLDIADYPTEQIWKHKNSHGGIAKTVAKLKGLNPKLIVMEATGGLETPLRQTLDQAGLPVAVINPRRIRDFARSMGILAKTDKLDAKIMAYFAAKIEPTPHPPQDQDSGKVENLLVKRDQISDMLTAEKNRLKQSTNKTIQIRIQDLLKFSAGNSIIILSDISNCHLFSKNCIMVA